MKVTKVFIAAAVVRDFMLCTKNSESRSSFDQSRINAKLGASFSNWKRPWTMFETI